MTARVLNPKGFVVLPSGDFVLSGGIPANRFAVHRFSPHGELLETWHPIRETRHPRAAVLLAGGPLALLPDGTLRYSEASPHRILIYRTPRAPTLFAERKTLLPFIGDAFIRDEGGVTSLEWHFPQSRFVLGNGTRIMNVVALYQDDATIWEVYDVEGKLLSETRVGTTYEVWTATRSGQLLASQRLPETDEPVAVLLDVQLP